MVLGGSTPLWARAGTVVGGGRSQDTWPGKPVIEQATDFKNLLEPTDIKYKQKADNILRHKSSGAGPSGSPSDIGVSSLFRGDGGGSV